VITVALRHEPIATAAPCAVSESARIVAEICERLVELDEIKKFASADLVVKLAGIYHTAPHAYPMVIDLLHGRTESVCDSFNVRAHLRGKTKQAIHCEHSLAMRLLADHFPEVAEAIEDIRKSALLHEDRMSAADTLRAALEGSES